MSSRHFRQRGVPRPDTRGSISSGISTGLSHSPHVFVLMPLLFARQYPMLLQQGPKLPLPPIHHAPFPQGLLVGQAFAHGFRPDSRRPRDLQFLGKERIAAPIREQRLHLVVLGLTDLPFHAVDHVWIPGGALQFVTPVSRRLSRYAKCFSVTY